MITPRQRQLNMRAGQIQKKLGLKGPLEPGMLIQKARESKAIIREDNNSLSKQELAIRGLV